MASIPTSHPHAQTTGPRSNERTAGVLIATVAALVLIVGLGAAAWGLTDDTDPLSLEEGLISIAVFGGPALVFIVGAGLSVAGARRLLASGMMAAAGFIGFVGFGLTSLSRQDISACG